MSVTSFRLLPLKLRSTTRIVLFHSISFRASIAHIKLTTEFFPMKEPTSISNIAHHSEPRIYDNNSKVLHPPPSVSATQHGSLSSGTVSLPSHPAQLLTDESRCLRRILRRNLRIHTHPGLRNRPPYLRLSQLSYLFLFSAPLILLNFYSSSLLSAFLTFLIR